eukprot:Blabericola_migrator_1__1770@NODE_1479_length_4459_cov_8_118625_g970_i0_p3_GENE_NODE_1479_length_4459_cov_8_118625_g970_i0NODE_1479_length_4459_cov_8_118625_g970_i0_p3_ORF_typecomplete_len157_score12_63_NODE_1479_length_4459_cov_8_118625_g970_i039094379
MPAQFLVLLCPINFPTHSTLLRVLNETQQQVRESGSALAERVSQGSEVGLDLLNAADSRIAEVFTRSSEPLTIQRVDDDEPFTATILFYGKITFAVAAFLRALYVLRQRYCSRRGGDTGDDNIDMTPSPLYLDSRPPLRSTFSLRQQLVHSNLWRD